MNLTFMSKFFFLIRNSNQNNQLKVITMLEWKSHSITSNRLTKYNDYYILYIHMYILV